MCKELLFYGVESASESVELMSEWFMILPYVKLNISAYISKKFGTDEWPNYILGSLSEIDYRF